MGGGSCVNGGWIPMAAAICNGLPDPFQAMGGGNCINGGWIPRNCCGLEAALRVVPGPAEMPKAARPEHMLALLDRSLIDRRSMS
jgi:hypothetical protein